MKRMFIINPKAGKNRTLKAIHQVKEKLRQQKEPFHHVITESGIDVIRKTRQALHDGFEQIVAVGGDGTVHQVVNGFFENQQPINPQAVLAVANQGSGSDYFKTLAGVAHQDVDWLEMALGQVDRHFDLGIVKGEIIHPDSSFFMNEVSMGMSARIVELKERQADIVPRSLAYLVPTVLSFFSERPQLCRIESGSQRHEAEVLALFICKGKYAGGGMRFGKFVEPDDGKFEITIFTSLSAWRMVYHSRKLYSGELHRIPGVIRFRDHHLKVSGLEQKLDAEADGECLGAQDLEVELKPRAIRVSCLC